MEQPMAKPLVSFEFEVEKIIGISADGRYQVQWAPAWVSKFHLVGCEHLIQDFLQEQRAVNVVKSGPEHQGELLDRKDDLIENADLDHSSLNLHPEGEVQDSGCVDTGQRDRSGESSSEFPPNDLNQPPLVIVKEEEPDSEMIADREVEHFPVPSGPVSDYNQRAADTWNYTHGNCDDGIQRDDGFTNTVPISSNNLVQHLRSAHLPNISEKLVHASIDHCVTTPELSCNSGHKQSSVREDLDDNQIDDMRRNRNHPNVSSLTKDLDTSTGCVDSRSLTDSFFCGFCPKSFDKITQLNKHSLTHNQEKPFGCEVCGKTFAWKGNLTTHLRIHSGVKPHICEGCGKTFSDKSSCNRHSKRCQRNSMV